MKPTIVISEDGMFTSEPMSVVEICNYCCAALTGATQEVRASYESDPKSKLIDKELFDALNYSFSKCLELTFPEYELHPELTEEVLKKEDELLAEKVKDLPPVELSFETVEIPEDDTIRSELPQLSPDDKEDSSEV